MRTYAFIDAANLFYGGEKSVGWRIDYKKLRQYLENKYQVSKIYYFGGVEIHRFPFDYTEHHSVPITNLKKYLTDLIKTQDKEMSEAKLTLLDRHLNRVYFYSKLEEFGYDLVLKPVKTFFDNEGLSIRKANCDVDMAFFLMRDIRSFERAIILSGDGDFLPVLKFLRENKKEVLILSRKPRTAKEILKFAGG